jgi:23S rRNA (cytidine1920-2'-O)/16S rRNA (cytidine1409-2'-O)-methyltransferase
MSMASKPGKQRADIALVERGLCATRSEARNLIMAGRVRVGADDLVTKPGRPVAPGDDLRVERPSPYVSRGAEKLLAAVEVFQPAIAGRVCLDVGASTGGFTDVLLQHGASRVYAVDAGYGQLHYRLRKDPRVVCLERTNARYLSPAEIPEPIEILTADVSFISLTKVLPACAPLLAPGAWIMVLVKPQFEAARHEVGKGGVVRDPAVRERCVETVCAFAEKTFGWLRVGVVPSPITGPKGNREYVAGFRAPAPADRTAKSAGTETG